MNRPPHGRRRLSAKLLLCSAHHRIAKAGQDVLHAGEGENVVKNFVRFLIPFNQESFLTCPGMCWQGSIGKPESADRPSLIHDVNDAASIEPPKTNRSCQNGDDLPCLDWSFCRPRL